MTPTAAPRGVSTRSTGPIRPAGAHSRQGGRRTRCGRVSRGSLRGFAGPSQRAHGGVPRALRVISVDIRLKFGRRPRVPEPVNSPLPKVAPTAGCDSAIIGPRADPELGEHEVSLTRYLSGPNLGHPSPVLTIEIRGCKVSVIQIDPELRDIVGGSFKDLRVNACGHEAEGPQVAVPADPPAPGLRVLFARREGAHHVGLLGGPASRLPPARGTRGGRTRTPETRDADISPGQSAARCWLPTRSWCPPQGQSRPHHQRRQRPQRRQPRQPGHAARGGCTPGGGGIWPETPPEARPATTLLSPPLS